MRFRASKMPRVMVCAGSYLLNERYLDDSGDEADEGNAAHVHAADHLLKDLPISATVTNLEMFRAVSLYVKVCRSYMPQNVAEANATLCGIEDSFETNMMGLTVCGTTDFFSWSQDGTLTIIDLKYGHGWVEVQENWQLITYAVLMWLKYGNRTMPNKVRLGIVQPRANHPEGPVRWWGFEGVQLRNYRNMIQNQITVAQHEGAATQSGDQCRYCPSILDCHTNRAAVAHAIDFASDVARSDLTGADLAHELATVKRAGKLIGNRYTALESYATENIKSGGRVPGYCVKQTYGALQWDVKDPIAAGNDIGKDLAKPSTPITPTQAINSKLLTENEVAIMASRKLGAFKLQSENLTFAKELIANTNKQQ